MDLLNRQLNNALIHPRRSFQFFHKLILDIRDDLITEFLSFSRESFFDEKPTQDPA